VRLFVSIIVGMTILSMPITFGLAAGEQITVNSEGKLHAKRIGRYQEPKRVVEVVQLTDGVGYLILNRYFQKGKHATAPTDSSTILVLSISQQLVTPDNSVRRYAWYPNSTGDTITIISDLTSDTSKVVIEALIK